MTTIEPTGQILGATVRGVDLDKPLADSDFATVLHALGRHGVLRFPDQHLDATALRDFSRRFGSIQEMLSGFHEPGMPEVGILSNVVENGRAIGLADAGQDWQYTHRWTEGDVLAWDHIGTLHQAIADYGPDEPRLMKRCQVMADKVFDPAFLLEHAG